ncbi:hypothetical protein PRZ48_009008 [Zasmidium cellare]|uniref:Uncharacterized protein n=1 Tax=Zasmidium cellare TaxID=395010 RepID=A0ABR0EHV2_ZASCE|nr:hypothetical protein PRZ48_009008 [Zasmidium cellare]
MARLTLLVALSALAVLSVPAVAAPAIPAQATIEKAGPIVNITDFGMDETMFNVGNWSTQTILSERDAHDPITLDVTLYKIEDCGGYHHKALKHKQRVVENECHNFKKKFKGAWIHKDEDSPAPSNWRCWASLWEGHDCQGNPSTEWVPLVFTKKVWEYTDSTCIGNDDKVKSMRFYCKA